MICGFVCAKLVYKVYGDKVNVEVIKASRETAQVDFRILKKL